VIVWACNAPINTGKRNSGERIFGLVIVFLEGDDPAFTP
jgi:hypothetical protein